MIKMCVGMIGLIGQGTFLIWYIQRKQNILLLASTSIYLYYKLAYEQSICGGAVSTTCNIVRDQDNKQGYCPAKPKTECPALGIGLA
jgi:hypothetical protein